MASKIVRQLRGGQITIPVEFRRQLGINEDTLLRMTIDHGALHLTPVQVAEAGGGSAWLRELYDYFEPVRQEIRERGISEKEVNADIDAALKAVRAKRRTEQ